MGCAHTLATSTACEVLFLLPHQVSASLASASYAGRPLPVFDTLAFSSSAWHAMVACPPSWPTKPTTFAASGKELLLLRRWLASVALVALRGPPSSAGKTVRITLLGLGFVLHATSLSC